MPASRQNRTHPSGYGFFDGFVVPGAVNRGIQHEPHSTRRGVFVVSGFSIA
jgi:hypothetical protein